MFSYYGSKSKLVHLYPPPKYGRIIEPFAGSARYSLRYPENDVTLIDANPIVCRIWDWIIHECTMEIVQRIPCLKRGDSLRNPAHSWMPRPLRDLLGFSVNRGGEAPFHTVTPWSAGKRYGESLESTRLKARLLHFLPRVRHWKVVCASYDQYRANPLATWFVDPPYNSVAGDKYPYREMDYVALARWCRSRRGLTIVCENADLDWAWLPFKPLRKFRGTGRTTTEMVWMRRSGKVMVRGGNGRT